MPTFIKNRKIRAYYTTVEREKPSKVYIRHFLHSRSSGGFWAYIRDLSQSERMGNEAVAHQVVLQITIGYHPEIVNAWENVVFLDEEGNTYALKEKPDEYNYTKVDMKIRAYAFRDDKAYDRERDVYV